VTKTRPKTFKSKLHLQFVIVVYLDGKRGNEHLPFVIDCAPINGRKPYCLCNYFSISTNFASILELYNMMIIPNHFPSYFKQLKVLFMTILELPSLVTYVVQPT
jgi:hypothetical protein